MRILVLSDTYPPHNFGGAGEVAALVAEGLAWRGHEVLVVTAGQRGGGSQESGIRGQGSGVRSWAVDHARAPRSLYNPGDTVVFVMALSPPRRVAGVPVACLAAVAQEIERGAESQAQ